MKKFLTAIMALAMIAGTASCSKDEDDDNNNNGGSSSGSVTEYAENLSEGIYQPKLHLSSANYGTATSTFTWEGNLLKSMSGGTGNATFTYAADGHLKSVSLSGDNYHYAYNGSELSSIRLTSGVMGLMAHQDVTHNGGHIVALDYDSVSNIYLMQLASEYLPTDFKGNHKFSLGTATINEQFTWTGNNVTEQKMTGSITVGIAPAEIANLVNFRTLINAYLSSQSIDTNSAIIKPIVTQLVNSLETDTVEMPIDIEIVREQTYTYDNQRNMMQNFWPYGLSAINLSANNYLSMKQVVTLNATAHYTLPASMSMLATLLGGNSTIDIPYNTEVSNESESYTYDYNSYGFPTKATSKTGDVVTFCYF